MEAYTRKRWNTAEALLEFDAGLPTRESLESDFFSKLKSRDNVMRALWLQRAN
jgi:hypothetical protein